MRWDWQRGKISLKETDSSVEGDSMQTGGMDGITEVMNDPCVQAILTEKK